MNISKPFIQRPVFTSLVIVTLVVFGILSYFKLPVSSIPQIEFPTIQVSTSYPGASPEVMANLISAPLERQFMAMQGIQFVASNNTYQNSLIVLQFHIDVDINVAAEEVSQAIQAALAQLPRDLPQQPTYTKFNPSDTPIIYVIVSSSTEPDGKLYEFAYNYLGQQIGTVNGLANIQTFGFPYAVRVKVDPEALAARNVTLAEVAQAINDANPYKPTGKFYGQSYSVVTKTHGQILQAEGYKDVIIKYVNGNPLRLKDVASVEDSTQNDHSIFFWIEDKKTTHAAALAIYRELGYNTVVACKGVSNMVEKLRSQIPASMNMIIPFSLEKWIVEAVEDVELTLLVAFCLVVIVVFLYLGKIRNSVIPIITLPITILGTFIFTYLLGFSLDIMSLSALTLVIGFLIDDAIVVLENIVRWTEHQGLSPLQAALKGSKQIIITVISISLCLSAVFTPMIFLTGATGQVFHEFAAVIIIAVVVSAFISLSLTPMLCSRFLPPYSHEEKKTRVERFSLWINNKMIGLYLPLLKKALRFKIFIVGIAVTTLGVSIWMMITMPKEFLPPNDLGLVQSVIIAPEGTSPEKTEKIAHRVASIIADNPYVERVGYATANPTDNETLMFYFLHDKKRPDIWKIIAQVQKKLDEEVIGVRVFQKAYPLINLQIGSVQSGLAQFQLLIQSFDIAKLYALAPGFIDKLQASSKLQNVGTDFQPNAPLYDMALLRDQAYSYKNINATNIENALMYGFGETYISNMITPENLYYVILDMKDQFARSPQDLGMVYLSNNDQQQRPVAINSVTSGKWVTGPEMVNHVNSLPSITVSFDPKTGTPLSEAVAEINKIASESLDPAIMYSLVGNTKAFQQAMIQFIALLIIAIFVIYIILGILYENFLHPITPLSSVPFAMFGGLLTLVIFGQTLSIYALIGIMMLLGIVMKNGILVVDFALEVLEEKKCSIEDAVIEACHIRFRPIVMTTIAAMMGAVPIALGIGGTIAKGRAPLGIAVVGGLIIAQLVTLFVIPVVFIYIQKLSTFLTTKVAIFHDKTHEFTDD